MRRKILITGGQGFIGSSLTDKLLKLGHEVATFDALLHFIDKPFYFKRCQELRKKDSDTNLLKCIWRYTKF